MLTAVFGLLYMRVFLLLIYYVLNTMH